jgi:uncharacterized protein YktB (UPF0637 family)
VQIQGFTSKDFDVFTIPGLEARMEALIAEVRPKLEALGSHIAPYLSTLCGEEMYPHVAKHARRTVNPPDDTWVAWAHNKRGYKAHPHFQVGMWSTHLFIQFAIIYESNQHKKLFANYLENNLTSVMKSVPKSYFWSLDHMKPEVTLHQDMSKEDFAVMIDKLKHVKKSEIMCGIQIDQNDPAASNGDELINKIEQTFETLLPLYRNAY